MHLVRKFYHVRDFNLTSHGQRDFPAAGTGSEHMPCSPVDLSLAMYTHQILRIRTVLSCLQRSFDHVIIAGNRSEQ